MPRRVVIPLIAAGVLIVAALLFSAHRWREPSYQGFRLKDWLPGYDAGSRAADTDEAVRAMGAPSLPFLMEMVNATDSRSREALSDLADDLEIQQFHYVPADTQHRWALAAFRSLGPVAKPAVPELMRLLRSEPTRRTAELALGAIGGESMAPLTSALGDSRAQVRAAAAVALGECVSPVKAAPRRIPDAAESAEIASLAKNAWPALIRCLKDPDAGARASAATALGDFGLEPAATVQALCEALNDQDWRVRYSAAVALGRFREGARPALPALTKMLQEPDANVRAGAGFAIRMIDAETAEQAGAK